MTNGHVKYPHDVRRTFHSYSFWFLLPGPENHQKATGPENQEVSEGEDCLTTPESLPRRFPLMDLAQVFCQGVLVYRRKTVLNCVFGVWTFQKLIRFLWKLRRPESIIQVSTVRC